VRHLSQLTATRVDEEQLFFDTDLAHRHADQSAGEASLA
jgi:hypothetical protein